MVSSSNMVNIKARRLFYEKVLRFGSWNRLGPDIAPLSTSSNVPTDTRYQHLNWTAKPVDESEVDHTPTSPFADAFRPESDECVRTVVTIVDPADPSIVHRFWAKGRLRIPALLDPEYDTVTVWVARSGEWAAEASE